MSSYLMCANTRQHFWFEANCVRYLLLVCLKLEGKRHILTSAFTTFLVTQLIRLYDTYNYDTNRTRDVNKCCVRDALFAFLLAHII